MDSGERGIKGDYVKDVPYTTYDNRPQTPPSVVAPQQRRKVIQGLRTVNSGWNFFGNVEMLIIRVIPRVILAVFVNWLVFVVTDVSIIIRPAHDRGAL